MKLAIVTHFPENPDTPRGGVQAVSVTLAKALATFPDVEPHVVTTDVGRNAVARSTWGRITIHRLPRLGRTTLTDAIGAGRRQVTAYLLDLRPDIVHAHDTYGLMVDDLPIPRVFTIHGFIYGDTLVSGERFAWLRSKIWQWVETRGWARQPHIVAISPYVRERLAGIAQGVIHDIDNPIDESFFSIQRDDARPVIFSSAVICPRKNPVALIDALALVRADGVPAELRLAGAVTDPAYGDRLRDAIRRHGLGEHVALLGGISARAVAEELSRASVFALVSLEENSPLGIEEAMAAGVPVVTSNRCGMPYMVRHGETGYLVDPNDPADIARRLRCVLGDDDVRRSFGEKARAIARERFDPLVVARRTREVYCEALARAACAPATPGLSAHADRTR